MSNETNTAKNTANQNLVFRMLGIFTNHNDVTSSDLRDAALNMLDEMENGASLEPGPLTNKGIRNLVEKTDKLFNVLIVDEMRREVWSDVKAHVVDAYGGNGQPRAGTDLYKVSVDHRNGRRAVLIPINGAGVNGEPGIGTHMRSVQVEVNVRGIYVDAFLVIPTDIDTSDDRATYSVTAV